jgi:1-deoxyxylulose-5-phosphate synthase
MQTVRFGNSGMRVSRFCLGAMTFGEDLDEAQTARAVDEAIEHGVNFIDTADSYGRSEELLGRVLTPEKRERVYLATKVWVQHARDKSVGRNSRINITHALERSLGLMKTDYIDLLMLHHPDPETPLDETLATLDNLVAQGKTRYVGVANHYAWQMAYMLSQSRSRGLVPIVSQQACYNILDRAIEPETVPFLERFNVGLMCYGPLCRGILTGKYHQPGYTTEPIHESTAKRMRNFIDDEAVGRMVPQLREIADEQDLRLNQLAVLWLKSKPYVSTIILGGSKPEHFRDAYEVADRDLPEEVVKRIDEISEERRYRRFFNQPFSAGFALDGQV